MLCITVALQDKQLGTAQQDRLEQVWSQLRMPDKKRLDMAVKYSSDSRIKQLDDVSTGQGLIVLSHFH